MRKTDVAIVGGGIAGLYLSYLLDKAGIDFVTFEAKPRIGNKEFRGISDTCFQKLAVPEDLVLKKFNRVEVFSPLTYAFSQDMTAYSLRLDDIEREILGRIADEDHVVTGQRVESIQVDKSLVRTPKETVSARVIVLACGVNDDVRQQLGIRNRDVAEVFACVVEGDGAVENGVVLDNEQTRGLFGWMMSVDDDRMELGISTRERGMTDWRENLFSMRKFRKYKHSKVVEELHGFTPLSATNRSCGENWLVLGAAGNGQPLIGAPLLQCVEEAEVAVDTIVDYLQDERDLSGFSRYWQTRYRQPNMWFLKVAQGLMRNIDRRGVEFLMRSIGHLVPLEKI